MLFFVPFMHLCKIVLKTVCHSSIFMLLLLQVNVISIKGFHFFS